MTKYPNCPKCNSNQMRKHIVNKVSYWKSGFYHIAMGAHVPIQLAFIDYASKTGGAGPLIYPSGDIDRDMIIIRDFYLSVKGKHSSQTNPAAVFTKT